VPTIMKGVIVNYRMKTTREVIVKPYEINSRKDAFKIVGKVVRWIDMKGRVWKGKVTNAHGNSGCVRVRFKKPLPAYSLGTQVEIEA
jgi:ribosomal protein L35AE/L33A